MTSLYFPCMVLGLTKHLYLMLVMPIRIKYLFVPTFHIAQSINSL